MFNLNELTSLYLLVWRRLDDDFKNYHIFEGDGKKYYLRGFNSHFEIYKKITEMLGMEINEELQVMYEKINSKTL